MFNVIDMRITDSTDSTIPSNITESETYVMSHYTPIEISIYMKDRIDIHFWCNSFSDETETNKKIGQWMRSLQTGLKKETLIF